ncbi:hypothetical protein B0J14DRAFT_655023 [Halenospora varia]|nr:hypothetical protein B0J14DRAFT_655023 [Halenospora varia]
MTDTPSTSEGPIVPTVAWPAPEPTTFHSLPFELREQIWMETLTPRLIYLHPSKRHVLTDYDPAKRCTEDSRHCVVSVRFNHSVHTPGITPAEEFRSYSSFALPEPSTIWEGDLPPQEEQAKFMVGRPLQYNSADPPAALYVCSESRQAAIRKGYVLAFRGKDLHLEGEDKEYWEKNNLGEKGVWVDFERDMIMVDVSLDPDPHPRCESLRPLRLMKSYARRDTRRVQRLALGDTCRRPEMARQSWRQGWMRSIGFKALEEIWVDDEFSQLSPILSGPERAESRITTEMERGMSFFPKVENAEILPLPVVKVVRGAQWDEHF